MGTVSALRIFRLRRKIDGARWEVRAFWTAGEGASLLKETGLDRDPAIAAQIKRWTA